MKKGRVAVIILLLMSSPFLWFGYTGMIQPWLLTNAFIKVLVAGDAQAIRARIAPDVRAGVTDKQIAQWTEGVAGHSGWTFARKSSSMGRTRGGKSTLTQRGYLHYPNSSDERYFSASYIEMDGEWYVDSFRLGNRETPR